MPEAGGASVNEVCEDWTTGPVTLMSYFPGVSVAGSLSVRVNGPAVAANVLLIAVFVPLCSFTVIVRLAGAATVPVTVRVLLLSLPDFQVIFPFGGATVVVGSGGTGAFVITIWRVTGAPWFAGRVARAGRDGVGAGRAEHVGDGSRRSLRRHRRSSKLAPPRRTAARCRWSSRTSRPAARWFPSRGRLPR